MKPNKPSPITIQAFTLMELMIVIVIIGVIASFALPQYHKTVERAYEREAIRNLTMVHAAEQVYQVENGTYWNSGTQGDCLANLNTNLRLNIIAGEMTYGCDGDGTLFTFTADRAGSLGDFTVSVTDAELSSTNPSCTAGACP